MIRRLGGFSRSDREDSHMATNAGSGSAGRGLRLHWRRGRAPDLVDALEGRVDGNDAVRQRSKRLYATDASAYEVAIGVVVPGRRRTAAVFEYCCEEGFRCCPARASFRRQTVNGRSSRSHRFDGRGAVVDRRRRSAEGLGDLNATVEPRAGAIKRGATRRPQRAAGRASLTGGKTDRVLAWQTGRVTTFRRSAAQSATTRRISHSLKYGENRPLRRGAGGR